VQFKTLWKHDENNTLPPGSLAQDANGLNYFSLPFQASFAMTTGVVETNGLNHRTYRKSAIAPNLLLQANYKHTGAENALAGLASQRLQAASAAFC
jgi:hypothetical protein